MESTSSSCMSLASRATSPPLSSSVDELVTCPSHMTLTSLMDDGSAVGISAGPTLNDLTLCTDVITELEEIEAMLSPQFGGLFSMPLSNISKEDLGEMQASYSPPRNIGIGIFSDSSCTFPISDERSMSTVAPADELNKEIDILMGSFNDSVSFVSPSPVQPEGIYALGDALNSLSLRDQSFISPYFVNYATFPLHPSLEASDPLAAMSHTDFHTEKGWLDFLHAVSPPAEALPALMSPFFNMSQEPDSPKEMDVVQRSSAPSPEPMDTREDEPVSTRTRLSQKRHRRVLTDLSISKTLFNQTRSALGLATTRNEESSLKPSTGTSAKKKRGMMQVGRMSKRRGSAKENSIHTSDSRPEKRARI